MRKLLENDDASFIPVVLYLLGLTVFGFITWMLDGILAIFVSLNLANTTSLGAYDILRFIWYGIVVIYLIFGGIWLIRTYNEYQYQQGMM